MVVVDKNQERREFSERLKAVLVEQFDAPVGRGQVKWFERELNRRSRRTVATYETYRQWLTGEEMPDQANMATLCKAFGINLTYLHSGDGPQLADQMSDAETEPALREFADAWPHLDENGRRFLRDALKHSIAVYTKKPEDKPA